MGPSSVVFVIGVGSSATAARGRVAARGGIAGVRAAAAAMKSVDIRRRKRYDAIYFGVTSALQCCVLDVAGAAMA